MLVANRGEPEVVEARITDSNGRVYYGWLSASKTPYLHDWPGDVRGHKVALDRRLPWKV